MSFKCEGKWLTHSSCKKQSGDSFPLDEIKVEKVIGTSEEFEADIPANLTSDKDVDKFISRYEVSNKEQLRITLDKDW